MSIKLLFADPNLLHLERSSYEPDRITLIVKTKSKQALCPQCHSPSAHLHSRYVRRLADLPWFGIPVRPEVHVRRLYCRPVECPQRIFCERIPTFVAPYARRTLRLNEALRLIGLAVGGEAGSRLAIALGMSVSPDTIIQRIRQIQLPTPHALKVIGVDDWAKHKGQSYGTILVDLERRSTIDLLPDREASSLATWLKQNPGVEFISRDRASAYAEGARQGAPSAVQIADRCHMLANMTAAVERFLNTKHSCLRQAVGRVNKTAGAAEELRAGVADMKRPSKLELWNERRRARQEKAHTLLISLTFHSRARHSNGMRELLSLLCCFEKATLSGRCNLALENLALRQQLAILKRTQKRPVINTKDRLFWVWLSRIWSEWRATLLIVKPDTVIGWHRKGFRLFLDQAIAAKNRRPPFCQFPN